MALKVIVTNEEMRDYIKVMCGAPAINIELPDDTIDQCIIDCCQTFSRYAYEDGTYNEYIIFTTSAGQTDYPLSAMKDSDGNTLSGVEAIYDFSVAVGLDGINTLFTPTHMLLHDSWVVQGNYPGGNVGAMGVNDGLTLTNYTIAQQYIKNINEIFGKQFTARYIPGKEIIKVTPTPDQQYTGVLVTYRRLDDMYLYNHPIVKKMCTGKVKIIWGRFILGKYGGSLPDGLTINADAIYENGKEEYEAALEECKTESSPPDFMIG